MITPYKDECKTDMYQMTDVSFFLFRIIGSFSRLRKSMLKAVVREVKAPSAEGNSAEINPMIKL